MYIWIIYIIIFIPPIDFSGQGHLASPDFSLHICGLQSPLIDQFALQVEVFFELLYGHDNKDFHCLWLCPGAIRQTEILTTEGDSVWEGPGPSLSGSPRFGLGQK